MTSSSPTRPGDRGLRKAEQLAGASFATHRLGTTLHYQLGQIARVKQFDIASVTLKPQGTLNDIARAIASGAADAAILPGNEARALLTGGQARLVAWYSEIDQTQLGALFASNKAIDARRAIVEKFVRAYRRAATEYAVLYLHNDRFGKRVTNARTREMSAKIARYVFPGRPAEQADRFGRGRDLPHGPRRAAGRRRHCAAGRLVPVAKPDRQERRGAGRA